MKNKNIGLWVALAFIIGGFIFASVGLVLGGTRGIFIDEQGLHLYQSNNYNKGTIEVSEKFQKMDINLEVGNIEIVPSSSSKVEVEYSYLDNKTINFLTEVKEGTLKIELKRKNGFFLNNFIGLSSLNNKTYVKVYLPKTEEEIERILVNNNIGDIILKNMNISELEASSDIGNITLEDSTIKKGDISSNLGNILLRRIVYSGLIKSDLGNTKCTDCEMSDVTLRQSTGNILYHGTLNNKIHIKNDLGNVTLDLLDNEDKFNYKLKNDLGNIKLNNKKFKSTEINNNSLHLIDIKTSTGNINIQTK